MSTLISKSLLTAALLAGFSFSANAAQPYFKKGFGGQLGYTGLNENVGLGLHARFPIVNGLRIEPTFDYYLRKDGLNMWDVMANFHYVFPVAQNKIGIYPLVGLGLAKSKLKWELEDRHGHYDVSASSTDFSMNFGVGLEFPVATDFSLGFELKGQLIDGDTEFASAFKVTYLF